MGSPVILLHGDLLINRAALAAALPGAWAYVLNAQCGGGIDNWQRAYESVAADWESYWADLNLNGDDSVSQWREGRWRTVRAWFRLSGFEPPDVDQMEYFLDGLTEVVGAQSGSAPAQTWRSGAVSTLDALAAQGQIVAIVDPYSPAALLRGMLVACREVVHRIVIGPDELAQVGLDGISWNCLASLADADPDQMQFVTPHLMREGNIIAPPADLADLHSLLSSGKHNPS